MTLTNKIRLELSFKISVQAMGKHAAAFNKQVVELNKKFTEAHVAYIEAVMPELPRKRWAELIQRGVLAGRISTSTTVRNPNREKDGSLTQSASSLGYVDTYKTLAGTDLNLFRECLEGAGKWSGSLTALCLRSNYNDKLTVNYQHYFGSTLPTTNESECISLYKLEPEHIGSLSPASRTRLEALKPLVSAVDALAKNWAKTISDALDYQGEVYSLLLSCRTRKQLEDVFPEAAKMLAPVPPKRSEIVPAELIANVRRRLVEGVPA
jgi:hypothetical protein